MSAFGFFWLEMHLCGIFVLLLNWPNSCWPSAMYLHLDMSNIITAVFSIFDHACFEWNYFDSCEGSWMCNVVLDIFYVEFILCIGIIHIVVVM